MAERIKGLQIDLSLESMNVSKGLAGVKREMRALNSSMKVSNNNFKHGDKSASAYKDRMSELQTAVDGGKSRLEELGKEHKRVSDEQGAGSKAAVDLANEYNREADTLNMYQSQLKQVTKEYKENYSVAGRMKKSFGAVGSGLQTVGEKAQSVGQSLTNSITKPAGIAATAAAGLTASLGFGRLVGLDTAKAKLEGLGYSTKEVGSITDQVTEAIDGGMTTMAEGVDIAAGALAAGVEEGDELQRYIKLVGDAAVGSGRDVGSMAQIFNRVQGQGKLMTQELNMVEEGMPGFSNAMAKHLDVGVEKFREMVTAGEVSSDDFLDVMDDFAGGMAESYSQSWQGMVANTKNYVGQIGESLLSGVFEQAKGSLHEFEAILKSDAAQQWAEETGVKIADTFTMIGEKINGIINWWNNLDNSTQQTLGNIAKWAGIAAVGIGPLLQIVGKVLSPFGGLLKIVSAMNTPMLILSGVAVAAGAALYSAYQKSDSFREVIGIVLDKVQDGWQWVKDFADVFWDFATALGEGLKPAGEWLLNDFLTPIGEFTGGVVVEVMNGIKNALDGMGTWLEQHNEGFGSFVKYFTVFATTLATIGAIKNVVGTISGVFTALSQAGGIMGALKGVVTMLGGPWAIAIAAAVTAGIALYKNWDTIKEYAIKLGRKIQEVWESIRDWTTEKFGAARDTAIKIWTTIKNKVIGFATGLWNGVKNIFTTLKNGVTAIFNGVRSFAISVWTAIKNTVVNLARGLWNGVRNIFNALKKGVTAIFNAVKNFLAKVWTTIKNTVVNLARGLWNSVRNTFNALKKGVTSIFNGVKTTAINIWTTIKNKVVGFAQSLWNGVKSKFNALKSGVSSIFNSVKDIAIKVWSTIKDKVQGFVDGMKKGVTGTVGKMRDSIEKIVDKIKGFFTGMIDKVKGGLQKLIDGVNWVGDKLGMGKIPDIKMHTGTEHTDTHNVVTNGKINRDTFATVGDKGKGNGPGGFRNEIIRYPNGKMFMTPNRDSTAYLPKGSSVYNGAQTHAMLNGMPAFAGGTGIWDKTKNFVSGAFNKAKDVVGKGKDWLADKVGDVWDWVSKPGKLVDKVLEAFGVNFDWIQGSLPSDMMGAMFKKLKKAVKDKFTSWFDEFGSMGEFDGAMGKSGKWKVYDYLWDVAQKVLKKFPGMTGVTSGYRPGDPNHHGKHQAIDIAYPTSMNGSRKYTEAGNWAFSHFPKQLAYVIANNKIKDRVGSGGQGITKTWKNWPSGGHLNHMHLSGLYGPGDVGKGGDGFAGGSGVARWKKTAIKALQMTGQYSKRNLNLLMNQMKSESNGNPRAINKWDSNARRGTPSKGLMQVIDPTFQSYKYPGHNNIYNPLDNILAAIRYTLAAYHGSLAAGWRGVGYETGGLINTPGWYNLAEDGYGEYVIPKDPSRQSDAMKILAIAANDIDRKKKGNKRPNQMRAPSNNHNDDGMLAMMAQQLKATQQQVELLTQLVASNQRIEKQPKGFSERDVSRAQGKRWDMEAYNLGGAY